ncbi:MAG TPA: shikimate kinase, partial [Polyangia bacterium]
MTRNIAVQESAGTPAPLIDRPIVLVGLMGAGKTSIGRRLAARLGMAFRDADAEIEIAAGCTIPELFARHGERAFRDGERRVIRRLLGGEPMVIASGGGAFMDAETRKAVRETALSVWLRCTIPVLTRRVAGRDNRPLLAGGDPAAILEELMARRHPIYAEADLIVDCGDESVDGTTARVMDAVLGWRAPRRLTVALASTRYDVVIGDGLLSRAGALLAPVLEQRRAIVVTDAVVARLHLAGLLAGLAATGIAAGHIVVAAGESSKTIET